MIEIEKGIPLTSKSRPAKWPLRQLEVGDSFFAPDRTATAMCGSMSHAAKATGFKFTVRTVDGGVRVWRVA